MPSKTKRLRRGANQKTRKRYIRKLLEIYPECKHDSHINHSKYEGHKITYGEMEYDGIEQLYTQLLKTNANIDCFIDIGSGRGKLCFYMAAKPKIKHVLGVELVEERHNDATILKSELKTEYSKKVELFNSNIFDIDLTKHHGKTPFIWFSNLCFDQSITDKIFDKLTTELPEGSFICCSKNPENTSMKKLDQIQIPMSWSTTSNVYIYQI